MPRPRTRPQSEPTAFATWLGEELVKKRSNQNKMAVATGIARATVNAWFSVGRIPTPELCKAVAEYLHVPEEEVLIRAGHLSPDHPYEKPDIPGWLLDALNGLNEEDLRVVAGTARALREVRRRYPTDEDLQNAP